MKKIVIIKDKILKLSNCIIRNCMENELVNTGKIKYMFENYLKNNGLKQVGPNIVYSSLKFENDRPQIITSLLVQIENDNKLVLDKPYIFEKEVVVEKCLFAEFKGNIKYLPLAYQKMEVYAYENDLILKGDKYTVYLMEDSTNTIVHVFMPTLA